MRQVLRVFRSLGITFCPHLHVDGKSKGVLEYRRRTLEFLSPAEQQDYDEYKKEEERYGSENSDQHLDVLLAFFPRCNCDAEKRVSNLELYISI